MQERADKQQLAEKQAKAQFSASSAAVWSLAGGRPEQLWMLDVEQLRKRCSQERLSASGSREALITRLVDKFCSSGRQRLGVDLPRDLHALADAELAAVCAAHGVKGVRGREDRLEALEELRLDKAFPAALEGPPARKSVADAPTRVASPAKVVGKAEEPAAKKVRVTTKTAPLAVAAKAKMRGRMKAKVGAKAKPQTKAKAKVKAAAKVKAKVKAKAKASAAKAKTAAKKR